MGENLVQKYKLSFINDQDLYNHVKDTVLKYRYKINLDDFNKNIIDPIKLTFDAKIYGLSIVEIIQNESLRQIDKSNSNHIGYFHQNIFKYFGKGWEVPKQGYDIVNKEQNIFIELKNKHNTMNSGSAQKVYKSMQNTILENDKATCMLVEVIAKKSQDEAWECSVDGNKRKHEKIRRVSIDKLYEKVTGEKNAFFHLCKVLPTVLDDVLMEIKEISLHNSVQDDLGKDNIDILKSLYSLAFSTYEGFSDI
ncbi:MAG: restriction endonuclease [Treponema sp. CETP13]|nr:MAG: restriction endonuclease [Treponema sp. CETP13]